MRVRCTAWNVAQLVMAVGLAAVAGAFIYASTHDDFPLGEAIVCSFTWMIVVPAWIVAALVRRHYTKQRTAAQGFEVLPPTGEQRHEKADA